MAVITRIRSHQKLAKKAPAMRRNATRTAVSRDFQGRIPPAISIHIQSGLTSLNQSCCNAIIGITSKYLLSILVIYGNLIIGIIDNHCIYYTALEHLFTFMHICWNAIIEKKWC